MIDHTGINVKDVNESKAFYSRALAPIGYTVLAEFPGVAGLGVAPKPDFWLAGGTPNDPPIHVAFRVDTRQLVDAFHAAAIAAGGRDNGAPGVRAHYHPNYYGAFVLDPDGHNVEVVCHNPA
jgi:catechol 2,3-dioxygenase-like lactoylglutathione lyase family enzyme